MEGSNSKADFEEKISLFFSTDSVAPCDMNDPDKNYFNDKLQEIDFPYFSFQNFKIFSRELKEKAFIYLFILSLKLTNLQNLHIQ